MKLTINLVPSTSWFNNVRSAVSKKQWDDLKSKVYSKAYYICEICGDVGPNHPVECHEIWDFDNKNSIQTLIGMIALCPKCHNVQHFGLSEIRGLRDQTLKHFMKINKFDKITAEKHIKEAFDLWDKRSKKKWTVDISLLEKDYGIDISKLKKE